MNKSLIFALISTALSASAFATVTGNNSCQGNCPSTTPASSTSTSSTGPVHVISNPSSASSSHASGGNATSSATGGNAKSRSRSNSTSKATGGAGGVGGTGIAAGGTGVGSQGQTTSVDSHVEAVRRSAASAVAAPLTSSNDTCMGSSSGAVQAPGLGVSIGTTWTDKNCVMLKNSRELWNMGLKEAALARLCMDADNKEAIEVSGLRCPERKQQASGPSMTQGNGASSSDIYTGNDNIVRRRLGLPLVKETN